MNRRIMTVIGAVTLVIVICGTMLCMTGCGKDVKIEINDAGVITEADANTNMTVKEILDNAGISLGEKDETEPKSDEKLGEKTEIIVKRYAKVTVKKGDKEKTVELVGGTVENAVKKAGFTLDDNTMCDVNESSYLKDKMVITLTNSVAINLQADGKTEKCKTFAKTVKDLLEEQKITLGKNDTVSPKLDNKIVDGMEVTVKRVEYKNKKVKEIISFDTVEQQSSSLDFGVTKVTQEGVNGEKEVTYKVKYIDGKEVSKKVISEKVIKEPVNKIVTVGTANQSAVSQQTQNNNTGANQNGKKVVSKKAVYDCDGSGHGYYEITYSDGTKEYEEF